MAARTLMLAARYASYEAHIMLPRFVLAAVLIGMAAYSAALAQSARPCCVGGTMT